MLPGIVAGHQLGRKIENELLECEFRAVWGIAVKDVAVDHTDAHHKVE